MTTPPLDLPVLRAKLRITKVTDNAEVLALLARAEAAEALVAERDKELLQIQGPCRAPGCMLHRAHNGPCNIGSLDGGA